MRFMVIVFYSIVPYMNSNSAPKGITKLPFCKSLV